MLELTVQTLGTLGSGLNAFFIIRLSIWRVRKDVMIGQKMFPKYSSIEDLVPSAMARAGASETWLILRF